MNVVCVGNMNNMLFGLVRYLRDRNINAHLVYLGNEMPHFYPQHDTFNNDFEKYCKQVKWGAIHTFLHTSAKEIRKDIGEPEFIIATDDGIPFLNKAGYIIDIIFPAGTDLTVKTTVFKRMKWYAKIINPGLYLFSLNYLKGFKKSKCINQENTQKIYREILARLRFQDKSYYFGCPMVYLRNYCFGQDNSNVDLLSKFIHTIREKNKLIIFYHNRLNWTGNGFSEEHHKGTDVLIDGFAKFLEKYQRTDAHLVLLEYGHDIEATHDLVKKLNISDYVTFLQKSSRKDLLLCLMQADFGCGQFSSGGLGGGTTWEVLAMGKPLLHYLDESQVRFSGFDSPFPFINVKTPDDICTVLSDFMQNPSKYQEVGKQAKEWYIRNFEEGSVNKWVELIEIKQKYGVEGLAKFVKVKAQEQQQKCIGD